MSFRLSGTIALLFCSAQTMCHAAQSFKSSPLSVQPGNAGLSRLTADETGVRFTNTLSPEHAAMNQILLNGSGVAAGDVDGDGKPDLYFCALEGANHLFRNSGNWKFEDITASAAVACENDESTGAAFADVDGDGDLDLLVNSIRKGTRLFLNDGQGHFREKTPPAFTHSRGSTSLALADVDGDGDLDLYVANYRSSTIRSTGFPTVLVNGRRMFPPEYEKRLSLSPQGRVMEAGEPDSLFINNGNGEFTVAKWEDFFQYSSGRPVREAPADWGLSVAFRDLNEDGSPDLYICNDFHTPDRIWLNDGTGHFREAPETMLRTIPTFSMNADFADVDRDGHDDFFAADMLEPCRRARLRQTHGEDPQPIGQHLSRVQVERNTLQKNRGDATFADLAHLAGIDGTGWTWSVVFLDMDLDGYEDLLVGRGTMFNLQDRDANEAIERAGPYRREMIPRKLLMYPGFPERRLAFRNNGNLTFTESGSAWGFNETGIAQGICLADLDGDGDLDVVVNNLNAPAGLYRNNCGAPRVAVRLRGAGKNSRGIGAKVRVFNGAVPLQSQEMMCGGRYFSADEPLRVFAARPGAADMRVEVTWRSGRRSEVTRAAANQVLEIAESESKEPPIPPKKEAPQLFEDVSGMLAHTHHEEAYDDFARQGLLPRKLSQGGPGVSWVDLDGDGREELIVGSGRGGKLAVFRNEGSGKLVRGEPAFPGQPAARDETTILGFSDHGASARLLVGTANYEDGLLERGAVSAYDFAAGSVSEAVPAGESSPGPLALADLDGSGTLKLFVGGRVISGRYPEAASSAIYRWNGTKWERDERNSAVLKNIGLACGAVWTDLNGDGFPELAIACEWGPVRVFQNERGTLREATEEWGLGKMTGWWNGVTAGDFDGDGRMDLAASNWGLNSKYHVVKGAGPRLYFGRWGGAGEVEMFEASFDAELGKWAPERDLTSVSRSVPWVREKFRSHHAWSEAGIEDVLADHLKQTTVLEANWLETTVFLNRGDHFVPVKLPMEAQFSPAFGVTVADFDGDGHEDIFLSQNFFAVEPQSSRCDAGRGLLLRGAGNGQFSAIGGQFSGIKVYGEQRGSAAADYDGDGRVDLAIGQNGAPTMLYHNVTALPGLRVRLHGAKGNPQGIGAVMRLAFGESYGPAREIHAGSGYWSQDSSVQVLSTPRPADRIIIVWPGGRRTEAALPAGAREVALDERTGALSVVR